MANANRLKKDLSTTRPKPIEGQLILEDGSRFNGLKIGSPNMEIGEVCFNTSMTGYQEIITDPSYACLLYTSPSPRDVRSSRMPSSA